MARRRKMPAYSKVYRDPYPKGSTAHLPGSKAGIDVLRELAGKKKGRKR